MIDLPTNKIKSKLKELNFNFSTLLANPIANPKIKKGLKLGVLTYPLHLAPFKKSGFNVCASASKMCIKMCLDEAGNPAYFNAKEKARINRTQAYFKARPLFLELLKREILKAINYGKKKNMIVAFRLNATSDIRFESVYLPNENISVIDFVIKNGGEVYDYTKHTNRKNIPEKYKLTFSWAGDNEQKCIEAFNNGFNVAIPFSTKANKELPDRFKLGNKWVKVFDGDNVNGDYRIKDPKNIIVGLRLKYLTSPNSPNRLSQLKNAIQSGFCIDAVNDKRITA